MVLDVVPVTTALARNGHGVGRAVLVVDELELIDFLGIGDQNDRERELLVGSGTRLEEDLRVRGVVSFYRHLLDVGHDLSMLIALDAYGDECLDRRCADDVASELHGFTHDRSDECEPWKGTFGLHKYAPKACLESTRMNTLYNNHYGSSIDTLTN